ncbi:hypothetical protein Tco_0502766 [Tanacetum coccineum]
MQALMSSDDVYGLYELYSTSAEKIESIEEVEKPREVNPFIQELLDQYQQLFQTSSSLNPQRLIDHENFLLPNTKPVNIRPYRYLHYKDIETEKTVTEMLDQGIIRFGQSPFSSPVLLLMGFDFVNEYKPCATNKVAEALSRVHEEEEMVYSAFMALCTPIMGILDDLRSENKCLEELNKLNKRLSDGEVLHGFSQHDGLLIF